MGHFSYRARRRYRILCLHGMGTNSNVFELQTAALRYRLGGDYDFDFVDGPYPWPAASGIEAVFGNQSFYSYHDGTADSVKEAVEDLADHVADNGPYDAVMGFSLGAALAATLLLRDAEHHQSVSGFGSRCDSPTAADLKCAIFVCATLPADWQALEDGVLRQPTAHEITGRISIPTVHAWSRYDSQFHQQSAQLVQMCDSTQRTEVLHGINHGVPTCGKDLDNLVYAIQKTMAQLES